MKHSIKGQKYLKIVIAVLLSANFYSCTQNRLKVNVSNINATVNINRFDRELFALDTNNYMPGIKALERKYPDIFQIFISHLYADYFKKYPKNDSDLILSSWRALFNENPYMKEVYRDAQKIYTDAEVKAIEKELIDGFMHLRYYYPKDTLPKVTTLISSFGYKCFTTQGNNICICLDMFLGESYKYYHAQNIDFPDYLCRRLKKEYIAPEVLKNYFGMKYDEHEYTDKTLLSQIIYTGKMLYFLDAMMPDMNDSLKIEYSKDQLKWCKDNEREVWGYFSSKEVFYKTDENEKMKFMQDGPFTNAEGIPQESSPRLGEWLGWQIVRKYMNEHSDISLAQMLKDKDYKKLFLESKYRPRR